ncbi:hypothetical protein [Paenibacillus sp. 481]|uniref:hypothetical protein n=1 Tax=Paenibacillus sp. 481 TaxID=2835869 RepID=UPI001E602B74|nr:hypothetical protein [Paenibacillus sp. 481]UHA72167.1 hypothetical protein KIK04_15840 [Paenibacillus sp. 481]
MKKWLSMSFVFSLVLSLSLVSPVSSVSAKAVTASVLTAENGSEVVLDKVEVYKDANGYDRVSIKGTRPTNGEPQKYHITVNRQTGTYKTTLEGLSAADTREINASQQNTENSQLATSYWTAWVKGTVTDPQPINASLASLQVDLTWGINGSIVSFSSNNLTTWAAKPSSLGTNWFTKKSHKSAPSYRYSGNDAVKVVQEGSAEFYNYDFLDNNKITEASVWIQITGNNNKTYTYNHDTGFRGEASLLLDLDIVTN